MNRRRFLCGMTAASGLMMTGVAALAATYTDAVVSQLTKQGFYNIAVQTTLLGRVRILADRGDGQREIILNPRTGEVLRDTWQASGSATTMPIIDDIKDESGVNASGDAGSGDDNSGSGSGSDGSGSSGSGSDGGEDSSGSGSGSDDHGGDDNSGSGGSGASGSGASGSGASGSGASGSDGGGRSDDGGGDDDKSGKQD